MDSREYWRKREEENLVKYLKTETGYIKQINATYDYMMDQIQREINGFYAKYAKKDGISLSEAKKRVSKLDIEEYERKAAKYVKDKDFSKEANEEMRLYNATMKINRLEMLKANIGLELVSGYDELQKYFDEILTDRTLQEFERQAGILGKTVHNNQAAAHAIVNASFNNARYSDRIWMYQDMMKAELASLLKSGLIQGKNPRELARHLTKRFGVRKSDTERLMRTELARVQTEAQKQSFERNGYTQYEFIALGNACDICKAIDGKHYDVTKMVPGENASPMHPNCRCSVSAWEDSSDYEEWLNFLDNGGTTEEWNRLKNKNKDGIIKSEVVSGAKKTPGWKDRHAEREYEAIRKRTTDCYKIARNTGFSVEDVETIKAHMFINKHRFKDGTVRRFDADFEQVQAWDRLTQGKHKEIDTLLLKHELEESKIMNWQSLVYEDAHELANKKFNWWAEYIKEE